jgi:hypothetical protein
MNKALPFLLFALIFTGCKTYYIPVDSFTQQIKDIDSVELRTVSTKGPAGDIVSYKTYPIDYINVWIKRIIPLS